MDSRERVLEALSGARFDVPPVAIFTQSATKGQMDATGARWPEAHRDPEKMAVLGCAQAEMFGFDSVRVPFDITAEAERLGCGVGLGAEDNPPFITSRAVSGDPMEGTMEELDLMSPSEYLSGGATAAVCEAVSICAKRMDGRTAVCAGMLGPMGLLGQLMGVEGLAIASLTAPDWMERSAKTLTALQAEYAKGLRDAGAEIITIVESEAGADIIDPSGYMAVSGSLMKDLVPAGVKSVLHMCGACVPLLEDISRTGVDALSPDQCEPASDIMDGLKGRVAVAGSVDPVGALLLGTPDKIVAEARMYADAGYNVIAPGCGIAPLTPDGNMKALADAFKA